MSTGALSPFWTIWGFVLWIVVLSLPILIYLAIAELQRARKRRANEPTFTLGERLDRPPKELGPEHPMNRPPERNGSREKKRAG